MRQFKTLERFRDSIESDIALSRNDRNQGIDLRAGKCRAEEKTLTEFASHGVKTGRILFALDPFGDDRQLQLMGQGDDRNENCSAGLFIGGRKKAFVDLDGVEGKPAGRGQ